MSKSKRVKWYMIRMIRTNALLARNGKWMNFSSYGNRPQCYKVYKNKKHCQNRVDFYNNWRIVNNEEPLVEMIEMHSGLSFDSGNNVIKINMGSHPEWNENDPIGEEPCECEHCKRHLEKQMLAT